MFVADKFNINDKQMDKELVHLIDTCDNNGNKINVNSSKYIDVEGRYTSPSVLKLVDYIKYITIDVANKHFKGNIFKPFVYNTWLMRYDKGDYAKPHQHWPMTFSCVYYIKLENDSSGLYLTDRKKTINVKSGDVIVLNGSEKHEVFKTNSTRYVAAVNICHDVR